MSVDGTAQYSSRKRTARELAQWDEIFDRVAKLQPDEPTLWIGRGEYHALCSQWTQAAADFAKVVHNRPAGSDESVEYAFLLLLLDDSKGYQRFCQELIDRADDPEKSHESGTPFDMARVFAAGQEDVVGASRVVQWANHAIETGTNGQGWYWHALGLAQYRAEKYDLAIEVLQKSNAAWAVPETAQNWLVMAMAHFRLGHIDDAHQCLETAQELIENVRPTRPDQPVRRANNRAIPPTDWIEMNALLREAEALIEPSKSAK